MKTEDEIDNYLKSLTVENIDYLVRYGSGLLCWAQQQSADAWGEVYEAKREYKKAEGLAWKDLMNKTTTKGKPPSAKHMEMVIPLDPRVQATHTRYSQLEVRRKKIDSRTEALQKSLSLLPGMQGRANSMMNHG